MSKNRADQMVERLRNMQAAAPDIEASAVVSVDGLIMASALQQGVEEDRVVLVRQRRREVGAPAGDAVRLRQRLDLLGVAADQDRIGHHLVAVRQGRSALRADGADRADEVLVHAHPAGDAVHDDS